MLEPTEPKIEPNELCDELKALLAKYNIRRQRPYNHYTIEDNNGLLEDADGNTLQFDFYEEAEVYIIAEFA